VTDGLHVRQPRIRYFVRLKLRILANGMRGKGWRIALFALGIIGGLFAAVLGFSMFAAGSVAPSNTRGVYVAFLGSAVVVSWILLPLLFFGVDETLDPARFALLPLRRRTLVLGMLTAACVGIPPVVTLLASLGSVVGAAIRGGVGAVLVAVLGSLVGLLLCLAASRAVTSAFASMLRSRRIRDLAAVVLALLGVSCGPLPSLFWAFVAQGDSAEARAAAGVLSWTPLAAPYVAYLDVIAGDWAAAVARLAIGAVAIVLLLRWWTGTIESAMLGTTSATGARSGPAGQEGPVAALFPRFVRWLPRTRFGALTAREIRYWGRHPRRRAGLISLAAASIILPFGLWLGSTKSGDEGMPLPVAMMLAGIFLALVLANQFGTDGSAYGLHVLAGVPGQVEMRSRVAGLAVLALPLVAVGGAAAALITDALPQLPAALGVAVAGFGVSCALSCIVSVTAAYPLPDSTNPFAMSSGSGGAKGLLSFVSMLAALVLTVPPLITYFVVPDGWRWVTLPVGLVWGLLAAWAGTSIGGAILDRRSPEVLNAISTRG
jgi:ABC-2 type transport system permease protein